MLRVLVAAASALVLGACGTLPRPAAQDVATQSWSGDYRFQWAAGTQAARRGLPAPSQVRIRPITSAKEVPGAKADGNGPQWAISFVGEPGAPLPLIPFQAKGYEEMGWAVMRAGGKIACLESGSFMFVCRTHPGTTLSFGRQNDEQLTTKTGLFGVALHQGSFELTPLD